MTEAGIDPALVFDTTGRVRRPPARRLARELWALLSDRSPFLPPSDVGSGMSVLVIPAFLTGDGFTRRLRATLSEQGFRCHGWGLGVNWGPTPRIRAGLRDRLTALRAAEGRTLAVVGISLGGVLARDLAHDRAADIHHVATLASPIRLPTASPLAPLIRLLSARYDPAFDPNRLASPLPMPCTMIRTLDDGIVAWESCAVEQADGEIVEVRGPHMTIASRPETVAALRRRLPETFPPLARCAS